MTLKGVLFDLDGTLTDYSSSSEEGLKQAYQIFHDVYPLVTLDAFFDAYKRIIAEEYPITSQTGIRNSAFNNRKTRFKHMFRVLSVENDDLLNDMAIAYGKGRVSGAALHLGVQTVLKKLSGKFRLGIITEGSVETQTAQINRHGLNKYFSSVTISGATNFHKPDLELYRIAIEDMGIQAHSIAMVGDRIDWDLLPAKKLGMVTVLFCKDCITDDVERPMKTVDACFHDFKELPGLLANLDGENACR
ncbi:HAD family hydrolase [bacterium]|nr:HAD family hydrolase [candidate division CSSED10-310 bacterium]